MLAETYGIFVYQEQVMQAAQVLARLLAGRRRHAAPRDGQEEARGDGQAARRSSATARPGKGIAQAKADEVFDLMEKFAGYGFNKSHAAAYALLAYHTAWLKVHCTAEFYAANMTVEMDDTDKLKVLLDDAKQFGIGFEPPDVNRGVYRFEPVERQVACATAWVRSRAPARARSRPSSPRATAPASAKARAAGRSAACSTSARASTASASTSAWSRR